MKPLLELPMHAAWSATAITLLWVLTCPCARAQERIRPEWHPGGVLLVVRDKSGMVTSASPLYLASNRVGWNPGDLSMRLSGRSDLRWQILLPGPMGEPALEFKLTRGSWETVEIAADLADIPNRVLEAVDAGALGDSEPIVVEIEVERFADEREGAAGARGDETGRTRISGKVVRVQVVGGAGAAVGSVREVLVWLPPGYDDAANADRRYPVLYMMDGQNVFEFRPPTPGEWGADETATALIGEGRIEPVIIAAIPNSGRNRTVEYLPAAAMGVDGRGDEYLDWVVREVVPRVERAVRADGDATRRGIGGSSLGGLIALRAGQRHPDVFGRVLAESAALRLPDADLLESVFADVSAYRARTFVGMGGSEWGEGEAVRNAAWVRAAEAMAARLAGVVGQDEVALVVEPEHEHEEGAWGARLAGALEFLYPVEEREK
jgi:predicted alpha/beta superfamily hydrolase